MPNPENLVTGGPRPSAKRLPELTPGILDRIPRGPKGGYKWDLVGQFDTPERKAEVFALVYRDCADVSWAYKCAHPRLSWAKAKECGSAYLSTSDVQSALSIVDRRKQEAAASLDDDTASAEQQLRIAWEIAHNAESTPSERLKALTVYNQVKRATREEQERLRAGEAQPAELLEFLVEHGEGPSVNVPRGTSGGNGGESDVLGVPDPGS
jgi:hypothetical protein